jgi:predicted enzyme related to lactoylglutathione lyase
MFENAANGGKIVFDEYEIVGVGRMIRFEDSEGNVACAMHYA